MLLPEQIVAVPANVTVGTGDTLIVATVDTTALHGAVVTRTVYVVVTDGVRFANVAVIVAGFVVDDP